MCVVWACAVRLCDLQADKYDECRAEGHGVDTQEKKAGQLQLLGSKQLVHMRSHEPGAPGRGGYKFVLGTITTKTFVRTRTTSTKQVPIELVE